MSRAITTKTVIAALALLVAGPAPAATPAALAAPRSAGTGAFHLELERSSPAADEMVAGSPDRITLWFSQAPEMAGTSIHVVPEGAAPLDLGDPKADPEDPAVVHLALATPLAPGEYRVVWRAMARDGHVVRGDFGFMVHPAP